MESELSGIYRVKLVTKNIVRGSPRIQFMHMRVKSAYYSIRDDYGVNADETWMHGEWF